MDVRHFFLSYLFIVLNIIEKTVLLYLDVLDEVITNLAKEDPKLRNGRRKLAFDKIVEKVRMHNNNNK